MAKRDEATKAKDLDAAQRSIQRLRNLRPDLKAGKGTNAERIARCEDGIVACIRAVLVITGSADDTDRA